MEATLTIHRQSWGAYNRLELPLTGVSIAELINLAQKEATLQSGRWVNPAEIRLACSRSGQGLAASFTAGEGDDPLKFTLAIDLGNYLPELRELLHQFLEDSAVIQTLAANPALFSFPLPEQHRPALSEGDPHA